MRSSCGHSGTTRCDRFVFNRRHLFGRKVTVLRSKLTSSTSRPNTSSRRPPVSSIVAINGYANGMPLHSTLTLPDVRGRERKSGGAVPAVGAWRAWREHRLDDPHANPGSTILTGGPNRPGTTGTHVRTGRGNSHRKDRPDVYDPDVRAGPPTRNSRRRQGAPPEAPAKVDSAGSRAGPGAWRGRSHPKSARRAAATAPARISGIGRGVLPDHA